MTSKRIFFLFNSIIICIILTIFIKNIIKYSTTSLFTNIPTHLFPTNKETEELVVAVCGEDIDWIDNYASNYKLVTVYNKCEQNINLKSKNIKVINSSNIGGCDHAYLSYIIDRYEDLPDFVEFTKGSIKPTKEYKNCLICNESIFDFKKIQNFKLRDWKFTNKKNRLYTKNQPWKNSGYKNMKEWIKNNKFLSLNLYNKNICNIIFGGHFGATSKQIKNTSKNIWKQLISQQISPREEVDHFIERTWRPLLCKSKYKLVIVAIFKNEALAIKEWLQHYINEGVEHFYMIDNGSTDNWQSQVIEFPVTIYTDATKHKQEELYNKYFLKEVKQSSDWLMVVDLDEFMYSRKEYNKITDYLDTIDYDIGEISVKWKMFGSNGFIKQPNSIIKNFLKRFYLNNNIKEFNNKKSICNTFYLNKIGIHHNYIVNTKKINLKNDYNSPLHLNHYTIQSYEFFKNIKMTRGDSVYENNIRDENYFKKYDTNIVSDLELKLKSYEII